MQVFKKRYRYIQSFSQDDNIQTDTHLGFFRIGSSGENDTFINTCISRVLLLPHYGFSLYDDPPGRIIRKGKGDVPTLFQSKTLMNLGLSSLLKTVPSIDMFTDEGLASYRQMSVMILAGMAGPLADDLALLNHGVSASDSMLQESLAELYREPDKSHLRKMTEKIRDNASLYDEVFHLKHVDGTGYPDFIYLTSETLTSLVLSHATLQKLIKTKGEPLKSLFQIPLFPDQDKALLSNLFGYDQKKVHHVKWGEKTYELFGVLPGLFGFEGAIFDVATGLVTGKRKSLVRFLLLLNGLNLLGERDLRYLV